MTNYTIGTVLFSMRDRQYNNAELLPDPACSCFSCLLVLSTRRSQPSLRFAPANP